MERDEAWVLATLPRALAFATSLLRDRALAEDVAHDCYVRLLAKADTYDLARDGTKLLYKAITNACIDKNYRDRRLLSLEVEALGESRESPLADRRRLRPPRAGGPSRAGRGRRVRAWPIDGRPARCRRAQEPGILTRRDRRSPGHEPEQRRRARAPRAKDSWPSGSPGSWRRTPDESV